jgi:hypothetical protein
LPRPCCRGLPLPQAQGQPLGLLYDGRAEGYEDGGDDPCESRLAIGGLVANKAPGDLPHLTGGVLGLRRGRSEGRERHACGRGAGVDLVGADLEQVIAEARAF